jgi:solute carrier family 35 protein F1/2
VCRYGTRQILSAALAIVGLAVLLLFDGWAEGASSGKHPFVGDALVILGSTGYAASNVLSEQLLRETSSMELLTGLGGFATLLSLAGAIALELPGLQAVRWDARTVALMVAYTAVLYGFYKGVPMLLQLCGSTVRSFGTFAWSFDVLMA